MKATIMMIKSMFGKDDNSPKEMAKRLRLRFIGQSQRKKTERELAKLKKPTYIPNPNLDNEKND